MEAEVVLPKELWAKIFGYCNPISQELVQYSLVSKQFKNIIDTEMWRDLSQRDFPLHHSDRLQENNDLLQTPNDWRKIYRELFLYLIEKGRERCDRPNSNTCCVSCGTTSYCEEKCLQKAGDSRTDCPHLWCPDCTPTCSGCGDFWCGGCYDDMGGDSIFPCKECNRHNLLMISRSAKGYCLYCMCVCEWCGNLTGREA